MLVFDTSAGAAKAVAVALKSAAWPEVRGDSGGGRHALRRYGQRLRQPPSAAAAEEDRQDV